MTQRESLETRHLRMSGFSLRGQLSAKTYKEELKEGVVVSRRGAKAQSRGAKVQSYFFFHTTCIQNARSQKSAGGDHPNRLLFAILCVFASLR